MTKKRGCDVWLCGEAGMSVPKSYEELRSSLWETSKLCIMLQEERDSLREESKCLRKRVEDLNRKLQKERGKRA